jgi:type VI protein secretion system component VasK
MPQKNYEVPENGTAPERKPSEQALQVVDRAVGAVPVVAERVRHAVDQLSKPETREQELQTVQHQVNNLRDADARPAQVETFKQRLNADLERAEVKGADIRQQVTTRVVDEARKARERVEPVYRDRVEPTYKKRVEPVYKQRVEPVVRDRFQPVYRDRVEPTVRRVRERI